jgi:ketosteroid isomerase-like protein
VSQADVEIVGEALFPEHVDLVELLHTGEYQRAIRLDVLAPDAKVIFATPSGPPTEFHGADGFLEGWRDWLAPWASYTVEVEELIDAGDRVLAHARLTGETKRDHVRMEHPAAAVIEVRDGKISRIEFHLDRDEAAVAAGLK